MLAWVVLCALAAVGCTGGDRPELDEEPEAGTDGPVDGGALRLGLSGVATLDPAAADPANQSELMLVDLLYDGLTEFDPATGEVRPAVASGWSPNDELTVWTFTIDDQRTFADGRQIVADDVKRSLQRAAESGSDSLAGSRLDIVEGHAAFVEGGDELSGIKVVDDFTVEVTLSAPFAALPELLSAPAYGVSGDGDDSGVASESGPFGFDHASSTELVDEEGRPAFEEAVLSRAAWSQAHLDEVELHLFPDVVGSYKAFVDGDVDVSLVPGEEVEAAGERYGTGGFVPFHLILYFGFNLNDPVFESGEFRRALLQSVDRQAVVEEVFGASADVLEGLVAQGVAGADGDPCGEPCAYDVDAAKATLAQLFPEGDIPTVALDYFEDEQEQALAEALAAQLEAAGIPTELRPKPFDEYSSFAVSGKQQLFRFGWVGVYSSPDPYLAPPFSTGSIDNVTGFGSTAVDEALKSARSAVDVGERAAAYGEAERLIMEQTPVIPIAQFRTHAVIADDVRDLLVGVDGTFDPEVVWIQP
ncbi:MAG: putative deoxycholate-binding periplasmic protein YgiS [Acidimicrobiales bacterium]|nr:MAG: ABC transporter substrate-binding protein [Actinomycetota bacterium]MBV6509492.1 putative deoxycholate-binding periplasmic protein YgiS [Acidimicrobiales bacterium]RIK06636.1 MAG: hypothetical protein DCC48_06940 [Acidobacteriota bacterium]